MKASRRENHIYCVQFSKLIWVSVSSKLLSSVQKLSHNMQLQTDFWAKLKNSSFYFLNTKDQVGHQDATTGDYPEFRRMNKKVNRMAIVMVIMMANREP